MVGHRTENDQKTTLNRQTTDESLVIFCSVTNDLTSFLVIFCSATNDLTSFLVIFRS